LNLTIYLWAPRWQLSSIIDESVNGLFAKLTNKVNSRLKVQGIMIHDYWDHVVRVAFRLLDIEAENILEKKPKVDGVWA
jgi:hypothetical protein